MSIIIYFSVFLRLRFPSSLTNIIRFSSNMSLRTGLLIGMNPKNIDNNFRQLIQKEQVGTLYIQLLSELKLEAVDSNCQRNLFVNKQIFQKTVVDYYSMLQSINLDVRILLSNFKNANLLEVVTSKPIEVVYFDSSYSSSAIDSFVHTYVVNKSSKCRTISFPAVNHEKNFSFSETSQENVTTFSDFDNVVLGGTFDKLHSGHKILLSEAVLKCRKHLTVGVTTNAILQSKTLHELIDDIDTRMKIVNDFLNEIEPNLDYHIVPISDVYGPTKTDPSFQMIVVSSETIKGAEKINEYRESIGLNKLAVEIINLVNSLKESDNEEDKISSSNFRMRMLGTLLKSPAPRANLPQWPYIIGLTGGIASGKSSVSNHLEKLGCGCINCDKIGHKMYDIESEGYSFIRETFGLGVLNEDGSVNRKQLSSVVFGDKQQLQKLNSGLWPLILKNVKNEIYTCHSDKEVVIIEAALLIQANWMEECHEIWSCIIPPNEALNRLQSRNNLSAEEAQLRINSQPKNEDYVALSNVVFSTLWDTSYTQKQVEKSWYYLRQRLPVIN